MAADALPEVQFAGFARGKGEGAAQGVGAAFAACAVTPGLGSCTGSMCGALVIAWLAVCGTAAAVGGVAGAAASPGAASVRSAEAALSRTLSPTDVQDALRAQLTRAALQHSQPLAVVEPALAQSLAQKADYRPLAGQGIQTVVEARIVHVGTRGSGFDSPLTLLMQARARVIRTANNEELRRLDFLYEGEARPLRDWAAQDGKRLAAAAAEGYSRLGADLYDALFRRYPFPDRAFRGAGVLSAAFGLASLEPRMRGSVTSEAALARSIEWPAVSAQPLLRWEAFPRDSDRAAAAGDMARVQDVVYDLVVARERHLAPAEEAYRREGLRTAQHRLETPLPAGYYFWTVRARFRLEGRARVTEWSTTNFAAFGTASAPSRWSYRFRVPD